LQEMYGNKSISQYLKKLASGNPVPGGGSAAALVGATGAACLTKVVSFTIGKEKYKDVEKEMQRFLKDLEDLRENFMKLCSEDASAYQKLRDAFKIPKTPERVGKVEKALKEAMRVPLEICKNASRGLKLCPAVREKGNRNLASDVDCALNMLRCAYQSALLNVEINLKSIKDKKFVSRARENIAVMEKEINVLSEEIKNEVEGGVQ